MPPIAEYRGRSLVQAIRSPEERGFHDPASGRWIRSIRWVNPGWSGHEPPDWKYALHMQEGVLEHQRRFYRDDLEPAARAMMDEIMARIEDDGQIGGLPDDFGTGEYEYGLALSVLGLGAIAYAEREPVRAGAYLEAAHRVAEYVVRTYWPQSSEDGAMMLGGLARVLRAQEVLAAVSMDVADALPPARLDLRVPALAAAGPLRLRWSLPAGEAARLRVLDINGREQASLPIVATADQGGLSWEPRDDDGRWLSAGRYFMILETPRGRQVRGFVLVR